MTTGDELEDSRLKSVCPDCGTPYTRDDTTAACPDCKPARGQRPNHHYRGSARARGYDTAWDKLSRRARRLAGMCADCGTTEDLTTDHSIDAWKRKEAGLPIRLEDVEVVCRRCNAERGAARGNGPTHDRWRTGQLAQLVRELELEDDPGE